MEVMFPKGFNAELDLTDLSDDWVKTMSAAIKNEADSRGVTQRGSKHETKQSYETHILAAFRSEKLHKRTDQRYEATSLQVMKKIIPLLAVVDKDLSQIVEGHGESSETTNPRFRRQSGSTSHTKWENAEYFFQYPNDTDDFYTGLTLYFIKNRQYSNTEYNLSASWLSSELDDFMGGGVEESDFSEPSIHLPNVNEIAILDSTPPSVQFTQKASRGENFHMVVNSTGLVGTSIS